MKAQRAILLIVFLGIILRIISLNQSFWLDEAAQATISSHNLFAVNWGADFQPPLFYVLTHFWQSFGIREEWFLRLPSVFFGVATVYLTYYFFKKLFNEKVGLATSLLLATAPYHIYYSQEYRMYSFFAFLAILSWLFLWEKRWLWYGITILAAVFSHYFAFLLVFSQLVFVLISARGEWRKFLTTTIISLSPFLLWLPVLAQQLRTASNLISAWPRWREISSVAFWKFPALILAKFTVGVASPENKVTYGIFVIAMSIIFSFALFRLLQRQFQPRRLELALQQPKLVLLRSYFFIPLFASWILGLFIAINTPHRLLFILPAFYGILAVALGWDEGRAGRGMKYRDPEQSEGPAFIGLAIIFIINLFFSFSYLFNSHFHREDWRDAIAYTDNKLGVNGIALTEYIGPWAPMEWYSKKPEKYIGASNSMIATKQSLRSNLSSVLDTRSPILLYTYLFQLSDPQRLVEKFLIDQHYQLTEEKDFRGVGIIKVFSVKSM